VTRRAELLRDLVTASRPVKDLSKELAEFAWDSEEELVSLECSHVVKMLKEYLAGRRSATDVRAWAEAIEGRDDIGFASAAESALRDVIFELANPELGHVLTPLRAHHVLRRLRT